MRGIGRYVVRGAVHRVGGLIQRGVVGAMVLLVCVCGRRVRSKREALLSFWLETGRGSSRQINAAST